ncbi:MAG: hypothetical protein U0228_38270 [Myxococcaceae bacterium]
MLSTLALLVLADIAPGPFVPKRPPPPAGECTANDQCELSSFQGCCGSCCPGPPHAIRKGTNEALRCAAIDCALPNCDAVKCARPAPGTYVAVCRAGQCVAQQTTAQCSADVECKVAMMPPPSSAACHRTACGCCPSAEAVSIDTPVPLTRPTGPQPSAPPANGKPNYGLSTGGSSSTSGQQCPVCPAAPPATARCVQGQCVMTVTPPRPPPPG